MLIPDRLSLWVKGEKHNNNDPSHTKLICFHTFGVRRTIDVLDSENQPGSGSVQIRTGSESESGALGLTGDV